MDGDNLLRRCQQGEERALAELVEEHKAFVAGIAFRMLSRSDRVEDVVQEVFLQVFRGIKSFRGQAALSTWIYRIACRICYRELEGQRRREVETPYDDDLTSAEVINDPLDSTHAEGFEYQQVIKKWLGELPDQYRLALTLYYMQGRKYREVADIMEIPIGTVKTYLHRGRQYLRRKFVDEGYAD